MSVGRLSDQCGPNRRYPRMNIGKPGLSRAAAEKGHDMIARDEISSRDKGRKRV
jgi:hypothetical protein